MSDETCIGTVKFTIEIELYGHVVAEWVAEHAGLGLAQATDPELIETAVATAVAAAINGETERVFDISVVREREPKLLYKHRGQVERPAIRRGKPTYVPHEGYSRDGADGAVMYPWMTRAECQREAHLMGARARFTEDGMR